jgi:frataxin-like iron-binding protein CyaY
VKVVSLMLDSQEFQRKSDEALGKLYKTLAEASDEHGFDTDFGGALTIEFEDPPAKFVISPGKAGLGIRPYEEL